VDTNSNPNAVDFPIPANDDSSNSVKLIIDTVCESIKEGLGDRKATKDAAAKEESKKKSTEGAKA
jgi:small subunit ribosomal protein S2